MIECGRLAQVAANVLLFLIFLSTVIFVDNGHNLIRVPRTASCKKNTLLFRDREHVRVSFCSGMISDQISCGEKRARERATASKRRGGGYDVDERTNNEDEWTRRSERSDRSLIVFVAHKKRCTECRREQPRLLPRRRRRRQPSAAHASRRAVRKDSCIGDGDAAAATSVLVTVSGTAANTCLFRPRLRQPVAPGARPSVCSGTISVPGLLYRDPSPTTTTASP